MSTRIGVLMGGVSSEREISLRTGEAVIKALQELKYEVLPIDMREHVVARILAGRLNAAFIALHGKYGEDGRIQGLLEIMGIKYTGSGVLASAIAMDKWKSRMIFRMSEIPVPPSILLDRAGATAWKTGKGGLRFPVVVKPVREGSSVGIAIATTAAEFKRAATEAFKYDTEILVEKRIEGRDVQVAILDGKALGAIEVRPASGFYDYSAKYLAKDTEYVYPAPLAKRLYAKCLKVSEAAHHALGCRGVTRVDLMVDEDGPYVLEVNTLPGLTERSLVPKIAAAEGISFRDLVQKILGGADLGH